MGDVERARALIDAANRRASELSHVPSMAHPLHWRTQIEILRDDAAAALSSAETLEALSREHGMTFWSVAAELHSSWARGRLYDPMANVGELRRALKAFADQGAKLQSEFFGALMGQLEAEALGANSGLARIDEALSLAHSKRISLRSCLPVSRSRRHPSQARSNRNQSRRRSLSDRHRHREGPGRQKPRAVRVPLARQALSIDPPAQRSLRSARAGARRFFADARNARNRGGASAAGGAQVRPCQA